ncbi:32896_t:CDS:2, partial [Gigaspora margarita]
ELPGYQKLFNSKDMVILKQLVYKKVDWYLNELVYEMERITRKCAMVASLWWSLRYCGITRKKLHKAAQERNECTRSSFIAKIRENYTRDQLIFLDESSKDERSLTCYYRYSFVNPRSLYGSVPRKNSVIIMDNARIHQDEELVRLAWIKHHRDFFDSSDDPVYALEVACAHIISNMANAFFNASIYSE